MRVACPARRRLIGVILAWVPPERRRSAPESNPDVLSDGWRGVGESWSPHSAGRRCPLAGTGLPTRRPSRPAGLSALPLDVPWKRGDRERPRRLSKSQEAVINEAGANPARGARAHEVRSTRLAWGASDLATGGTDSLTGAGDRGQIPRPRKAQPRKARKGLPVSFMGDGAEP